jgi:hypothetical protein
MFYKQLQVIYFMELIIFVKVKIKIDKGKSPEVPFHEITLSYSYYFEFLRQFRRNKT